ncbi:unnamed protein product [Linum trigynum]|uniref:Uncharacterized protein n=1 Tax=Linum trigynum TaxID=586398 RepID=A0AAV2DTZ7_9ROSI
MSGEDLGFVVVISIIYAPFMLSTIQRQPSSANLPHHPLFTCYVPFPTMNQERPAYLTPPLAQFSRDLIALPRFDESHVPLTPTRPATPLQVKPELAPSNSILATVTAINQQFGFLAGGWRNQMGSSRDFAAAPFHIAK